jgi:hypothetical protein
MTWAQRLKRVFGIDTETCTGCGGKLRLIARMLTHLEKATCRLAQSEGSGGVEFPTRNQPRSILSSAVPSRGSTGEGSR